MSGYCIENGHEIFQGVHSETFTMDGNKASIVGTNFGNVEIVRIQGTITVNE